MYLHQMCVLNLYPIRFCNYASTAKWSITTLSTFHNPKHVNIDLFRRNMLFEIAKTQVGTLNRILPNVINDIVEYPLVRGANVANERMRKLLEYILPHGPTYGTTFYLADRWYAQQRDLKNKLLPNERKHFEFSCRIVWIIDMLFQSLHMVHDMIYGNHMRNNVQCWHTLQGNGVYALTDSHMLMHGAFLLLRKYCQEINMAHYDDFVHVFDDACYRCLITINEFGSSDTSNSVPNDSKCFTSFDNVFGPISISCQLIAAMRINGVQDPELEANITQIGFDLSLLTETVHKLACSPGYASIVGEQLKVIQNKEATMNYSKTLKLANSQYVKESHENELENMAEMCSVSDQFKSIESLRILQPQLLASIERRIVQLPKNDVPWVVITNYTQYLATVVSNTCLDL